MVCCLAWYVNMAWSCGKGIRQQRLWEGLAEGMAEGFAEGLSKGLAQGLARGTAWPARAAAQKSSAVHMNFFCKIDLFRHGRAHSDGKQDREIPYKNNGFEGGGGIVISIK